MSTSTINLIYLILAIITVVLMIVTIKKMSSNTAKTQKKKQRPILSTSTPKKGVQVDVLQHGSGPSAVAGKKVRCHYNAWLTNGEKVDSSYDKGEVFSFTLGRREVIPGWEAGMIGMKEGEIRKFTISPENAYGDSGKANVPPNATIIFEVELIKVI